MAEAVVGTHARRGLWALGFICVLLSASFGRPLWIDEVVQFALAGFDTPAAAWDALIPTLDGLNHGQTGAYYMLDFALMKLFGASSFWLRFPSLVFGFFLFASALHLFGQWRVPARWQAWGLLALFTHRWVAGYIGEARPYMPLAACTVGALAYYSTPAAARRRPGPRLIGAFSIVGGALFHPYFSVYWAFVCVFSYFHAVRRDGTAPGLGQFVAHCNPWLTLAGVLLYFGIAAPTWLSHHSQMPFDPFQWIPQQWSFPRHLYAQHFLFLKYFKIPFAVFFAVAAAGTWFVPGLRERKTLFVSALALIAGCLAISSVLSYLSYRSGYWILERQWIASITLVTLATTWFASLFADSFGRRFRVAWSILAFALLGYSALGTARTEIAKMYSWYRNPEPIENVTADTPVQDVGWEKLARANSASGGKVWPVFRKLYGR